MGVRWKLTERVPADWMDRLFLRLSMDARRFCRLQWRLLPGVDPDRLLLRLPPLLRSFPRLSLRSDGDRDCMRCCGGIAVLALSLRLNSPLGLLLAALAAATEEGVRPAAPPGPAHAAGLPGVVALVAKGVAEKVDRSKGLCAPPMRPLLPMLQVLKLLGTRVESRSSAAADASARAPTNMAASDSVATELSGSMRLAADSKGRISSTGSFERGVAALAIGALVMGAPWLGGTTGLPAAKGDTKVGAPWWEETTGFPAAKGDTNTGAPPPPEMAGGLRLGGPAGGPSGEPALRCAAANGDVKAGANAGGPPAESSPLGPGGLRVPPGLPAAKGDTKEGAPLAPLNRRLTGALGWAACATAAAARAASAAGSALRWQRALLKGLAIKGGAPLAASSGRDFTKGSASSSGTVREWARLSTASDGSRELQSTACSTDAFSHRIKKYCEYENRSYPTDVLKATVPHETDHLEQRGSLRNVTARYLSTSSTLTI